MVYERKIKYTSISISEPLMDEIKGYLKNHPGRYISAGDFMRDSIRRKLKS